MVKDVFSRKVVASEVHIAESSALAAELLKRGTLKERVFEVSLILHSDNGSAMKGSTMLATMQNLGVVPSFSRPRVSNDNAYAETLFRTAKYCPLWPSKPFESLEKAREWVATFVTSGLFKIVVASTRNFILSMRPSQIALDSGILRSGSSSF